MPLVSQHHVTVPDDVTYGGLLLQRAEQYREQVALIDPANDTKITFREFGERIRRLSHALYRAGLNKGDVIMTCFPNDVIHPIVFAAITYIGCTVLPCNPRYTEDEMRRLVNGCPPKAVFTTCHLALTLQKLSNLPTGRVWAVDAHVTHPTPPPSPPSFTPLPTLLTGTDPTFTSPVTISPRTDVAFVLSSSGTTGVPKGVCLTHYNFTAMLHIKSHPSVRSPSSGRSEVHAMFLPFFHVGGISFTSEFLFQGYAVIILPKYELNNFISCLQKYQVSVAVVVPPVVLQLVRRGGEDLSSVHTFVCGAAPIAHSLLQQLQRQTGARDVLNAYSMTETCTVGTQMPPGVTLHRSVGKPLPNTQIMVVDVDTGREVGAGHQGELLLRGPQVMLGYLNNPAATRHALGYDGWLRTGDVGYYDEDGFVYIVDRIKELIKWKGNQVAPAELESLLLQHVAVNDAAVVGIPDPEAGELPRAFVVKKPGHDVTEAELVQFVHERVSPPKRLRGGVRFLAEIPKSVTGKILRRVLRAGAAKL